MAEIETLPIDRIATEDTQVRVTLSDIIIREYAEGLTRGDVFPPIDVFFDGEAYWLADGFHRVKATTAAGLNTIAATVHQGGKRAALLHAVGANEEHGHRRTDADRRRAVHLLLTDPEWQEWNNSEIARRCRVSEFLVRTIRSELEPPQEKTEPPQRTRKVTRGGKTYPMRTGRIGSATPSKTPPVASRTESAAAPIPPTPLPEQQEGVDAAPVSSIASKTDIPPVPALYVHQEETPAGPAILPAQTEDEHRTEPIIPQPQPGLTDIWHQASTEERTLFVAMYHEELRTLLAAWDEQTQQRTSPRPASPKKKQRRKSIAS